MQNIDKFIPSIKVQKKEVSDETQKEFFVKKLIQKFNDLDSEITKLEEHRDEVLEQLDNLDTVQCIYCFEFCKKNETFRVENGFICKSCFK